jgi:transcriptional regulator with GAF, ATPase, and Fis domain
MQYYKDIKEYTQKQEQDMLWSMFDDIWPQHQFEDIEERTLASELADVERKAIVLALESNCWNQSKAARQLGMGRTLLIHKMKKYELSPISY